MSARHRHAARRRHEMLKAHAEVTLLVMSYEHVLADVIAKRKSGELPPNIGATVEVSLTALDAMARCRVVEINHEIQVHDEEARKL